MSLKYRAKSALLPKGRNVRTLPRGIGRGLRLRIDLHDGMVRTYLGLYEIELNKHLRRLARPGVPAFDIGGREGYDALVIVKHTRARVLTIDSDLECCEEIRRNVALNPKYAGLVEVAEGFVGAQGTTVDQLATDYFVPGFIKMDIEGGEVDALRGAEGILRTRKPSLLIEVHAADLEKEALDILGRAGYQRTLTVDPRRWLPDYRPIEHNRWIVCAE